MKWMRRRLNGNWCVYCGGFATVNHHFPPISYGATGWILPACLECSGFAGTKWPTSFDMRCDFVKQKLAKRYSRSREPQVAERLAWVPMEYLSGLIGAGEFLRWCGVATEADMELPGSPPMR